MRLSPDRYLITTRFHLTSAQRAQFQPESLNQNLVTELVAHAVSSLAALDNQLASNPTAAFYEYSGEGSSMARYDAMIVRVAFVLWVQQPVEWDTLRWRLSEATTAAVRKSGISPRGDMSGMLNSCSYPALFCVSQQTAGSYPGNAVPAPELAGTHTRLLYTRGYDPRANRTIPGPAQLTPIGPPIPAPPAPGQGQSLLPPDLGPDNGPGVPTWLAAALGIGLAGAVAYGFWLVTSPKALSFTRPNPRTAGGLPPGKGRVDILEAWEDPEFDPRVAAMAGVVLVDDGRGRFSLAVRGAPPDRDKTMTMAEALAQATAEERKTGKRLRRFVLRPDRSLSLIRPSGSMIHSWVWRSA